MTAVINKIKQQEQKEGGIFYSKLLLVFTALIAVAIIIMLYVMHARAAAANCYWVAKNWS